jgi:hypothetical protein
MIRCFRPATQDIRDLFTLQKALGHFTSPGRKHDCKVPPQDWQEPQFHSKSSLKNRAHPPEILLQSRKININSPDQGPPWPTWRGSSDSDCGAREAMPSQISQEI